MPLIDLVALGAFLLTCFAASLTGALFRPGDWYESLDRPAWRPPNWLFAPAWAVLYVMIAVAAWLVWRAAGFGGGGTALAVWAGSLLLNAAWSAVFFGLRRPDLAFAELVALWLSIAATIYVFAPIDATAAWLLVPYLCWVTFAGALNLSIARRNPSRPAPTPA